MFSEKCDKNALVHYFDEQTTLPTKAYYDLAELEIDSTKLR